MDYEQTSSPCALVSPLWTGIMNYITSQIIISWQGIGPPPSTTIAEQMEFAAQAWWELLSQGVCVCVGGGGRCREPYKRRWPRGGGAWGVGGGWTSPEGPNLLHLPPLYAYKCKLLLHCCTPCSASDFPPLTGENVGICAPACQLAPTLAPLPEEAPGSLFDSFGPTVDSTEAVSGAGSSTLWLS